MNLLRKILLVFCISILSNLSFSQSQNSNAEKASQYAAGKFAAARQLNIEFETVAPNSYTSNWGNIALPEGDKTDMTRVKLGSTFNLIRKQKWMLSTTIDYRHTSLTAETMNPISGSLSIFKEEYHYHSSSLNFTRFSSLFKKRIIYTSRFIVDGSEKHFERIKGMLSATMVLKATPRTKFMAGLLVNIDPSTQLPITPIVIYEHRFANDWMIDITFPKYAFVRKNIFTNARVSLGGDFDQTSLYLYDVEGTSQTYEFRQLEINTGLVYEHLIANYFILTAKTGMKFMPMARVFEKQESPSTHVFDAKPDPSLYFNIGISFNPFVKRKRN